jgi:hypothetical protein
MTKTRRHLIQGLILIPQYRRGLAKVLNDIRIMFFEQRQDIVTNDVAGIFSGLVRAVLDEL